MPSVQELLKWLVIFVAMPVHWVVVIALWRLLRTRRDNRLLRDRFLIATMLATVVTIFAGVFVNNDWLPPPLTVDQTRVITRAAMLSLVVPSLYWLSLYYRKPK